MFIFQHFDLEQHIWIETNVLRYALGGVLNQLILDDLGQCYLVNYYLYKMILAKTWYKTYSDKLLAIVKAFKTLRY